jgi:predicted glutamine amidotransferase
MCRLLGILANERTNFHFSLHAAPRSLASLSSAHPHGWGIAVFDPPHGWTVQKQPVRASECQHFFKASSTIKGELLLAHVRSRTVGPITAANTHPFWRERWLFAHNGTISNTEYLRAHTSPERLQRIEGQTDSELFFSYLLTQLDEAGITNEPASERTDDVLLQAMQKARSQPAFGACNFLLSDGKALYAHRFGRTLFVLERQPTDQVRVHRASHETGAAIDTPWTDHRHAVLIASEEMTEEPWTAVAEGALLRCDSRPQPSLRILSPGSPVAS